MYQTLNIAIIAVILARVQLNVDLSRFGWVKPFGNDSEV
jgi:hypothetical protein